MTVAPRVFLRTLVDVIDVVDQHDDYDPSAQFKLVIDTASLTAEELAAKEGREVVLPDDDDEPSRARRLDG